MAAKPRHYVEGEPCWADIMVRSNDRSEKFYGELFGWEFGDKIQSIGQYTMVRHGDNVVAGMSPMQVGMEDAPIKWATYLAVDDVKQSHDKILAANGRTLLEPTTVGDFGHTALYMDPTGATFGTWQAANHRGFESTHRHGTHVWSMLFTYNLDVSQAFYGEAFDFEFEESRILGMQHVFCLRNGRRVTGLGQFRSSTPAEDSQANWTDAFRVDDVDAAVRKVESLGGLVLDPPTDYISGRIAIVTGPDGEVFCLENPGSK